jgi:RNA polymerase sigma factor (sigma-70 family)
MSDTDRQSSLARRLLADDEDVLACILRELGPQIRAVLSHKYRGLLSHGDFEDVLAIGLFRLWNFRRQFDPEKGSLQVWFYRITVNATRDVLRHGWQKARKLEVEFEPGALSGVVDHRGDGQAFEHAVEVAGPDTQSGFDSDTIGMHPELREMLELLPATQRRIVLADAQSPDGQISSTQLGTELGLPAATVRVYRRRAIQRLKTEMDRRGWGGRGVEPFDP